MEEKTIISKNELNDLYNKLQLKDKMIELMAEEINKHNTSHTYFNNKNEEINIVCFYKALAELSNNEL